MKHLILGGARSGKSRYAETLAGELFDDLSGSERRLVYVATGVAGDTEMAARIEHHQKNRRADWQLVEEPLNLAGVLKRYPKTTDCLLIDCLTLWVSNGLHFDEGKMQWDRIRREFLAALSHTQASVFIVSNEVGSGIVPLGQLSRQFVDESGWLHQELAKIADQVSLVVAGLPLSLKR